MELANKMDYASIKIKSKLFPENRAVSLEYLSALLELLSNIDKSPIMLHFDKACDEATLYVPEIDILLQRESLLLQTGLWYPEVSICYDDDKLSLPDLTLLCTMKYPTFYVDMMLQQNSIPFRAKLSKDRVVESPLRMYKYIDLSHTIAIDIRGDLYYEDFNRSKKHFCLKELSQNHTRYFL
jgi:hypothetical protein